MSCNYAEGLSAYSDKGKCGLPEKFDEEEVVNEKVRTLAQWMKESKHTVLHTGAGISTAAGIPDFRGPNGVWTLEERGEKPNINVSFDDALPTKTHMAIVELVKAGYVQFIVSQNIDGLHLRSGLHRCHIAELHGNMFTSQCNQCQRQFVQPSAVPTVGQKALGLNCFVPKQNGRQCRGQLYDTILDWEDTLPDKDIRMSDAHATAANLNMTLGTSLQIVPSGNIPTYGKRNGGRLVICNLQPTKQDRKAHMKINSYVDDVMTKLMKELCLEIPDYEAASDPVLLARKLLDAGEERNGYPDWSITDEMLAKKPAVATQSVNNRKRKASNVGFSPSKAIKAEVKDEMDATENPDVQASHNGSQESPVKKETSPMLEVDQGSQLQDNSSSSGENDSKAPCNAASESTPVGEITAVWSGDTSQKDNTDLGSSSTQNPVHSTEIHTSVGSSKLLENRDTCSPSIDSSETGASSNQTDSSNTEKIPLEVETDNSPMEVEADGVVSSEPSCSTNEEPINSANGEPRHGDEKRRKPGVTGPRKPGEEEPRKPGDREPRNPGNGEPRKPGDREPRKTGDREPRKPGDREPGKTDDREPGKTDDREPRKPSDMEPRNPGDREPRNPGDREPRNPVDREPRNPGDREPRNPGDREPRNPGDREPRNPGDREPRNPGDREPRNPGDREPRNPGDREPRNPGDREPRNPGDREPRNPGDREPRNPGDREPRNPGDREPRNPGDREPRNPGDREPRNPGDREPRNPGDREPRNPGDREPRNPGDREPRNPGDREPRNPGDGQSKNSGEDGNPAGSSIINSNTAPPNTVPCTFESGTTSQDQQSHDVISFPSSGSSSDNVYPTSAAENPLPICIVSSKVDGDRSSEADSCSRQETSSTENVEYPTTSRTVGFPRCPKKPTNVQGKLVSSSEAKAVEKSPPGFDTASQVSSSTKESAVGSRSGSSNDMEDEPIRLDPRYTVQRSRVKGVLCRSTESETVVASSSETCASRCKQQAVSEICIGSANVESVSSVRNLMERRVLLEPSGTSRDEILPEGSGVDRQEVLPETSGTGQHESPNPSSTRSSEESVSSASSRREGGGAIISNTREVGLPTIEQAHPNAGTTQEGPEPSSSSNPEEYVVPRKSVIQNSACSRESSREAEASATREPVAGCSGSAQVISSTFTERARVTVIRNPVISSTERVVVDTNSPSPEITSSDTEDPRLSMGNALDSTRERNDISSSCETWTRNAAQVRDNTSCGKEVSTSSEVSESAVAESFVGRDNISSSSSVSSSSTSQRRNDGISSSHDAVEGGVGEEVCTSSVSSSGDAVEPGNTADSHLASNNNEDGNS